MVNFEVGFRLRCLIIDEEKPVRAAALRILRHAVYDVDTLLTALLLKIDLLIARYASRCNKQSEMSKSI